MQSITQQITASLGILGNSSTEIANNLANKGIKGTIGSYQSCPLAAYLTEQYPGVSISVGAYSVSAMKDARDEVYSQQVSLSAAQRDFVHAFDRGLFPDLDITR